MSRITISVNGVEVLGNRHEPLLTQLEQAGLQPEYQCRNGMCGACRCKLKTGIVDQQDTIAFVQPSEILTCRSIPRSDVAIEFDYDLVSVFEPKKTKAAL